MKLEREITLLRFTLFVLAVVLLVGAPFHTYAADCQPKEKSILKEEYDKKVRKFTTFTERTGVKKKLLNIQYQIKRGGRTGAGEIMLSLRSVHKLIRDVKKEGEDLRLDFSALERKQEFKACKGELKIHEKELQNHFNKAIAALEEEMKSLEKKASTATVANSNAPRILQAPVWGINEDTEGTTNTVEVVVAEEAMTSQQIFEKIKELIKQLEHLFAEYTKARLQEQTKEV